ncbi:MAG: exosortase/archaeosortase family protein [Nitrospinota bacterium]|nr:exosortase/archaeosortase family protein [Nitrospinota bacterium]
MKAVFVLILLVGGGFAYFQPMRWLIESWIVNPYYQHGFVVALAAIAMTVYRIVKFKDTGETNHLWIYFLGVSIVLYLTGIMTGLNYLKTVPIFFTLLSIAYLLSNHVPAHRLHFPLLFPILAVPIPFLPEITAFLQFAMTGLSTGLLKIFGYEISSEGAMVYLPNATFLIGEPSSGIQSLIALSTLMIPIIYFTKTSSCKKIYLYFLIVPTAMLGNLMRIVALFIVANAYGATEAHAFWHDTGNIIFFIFTLILLFIPWYLIVFGFNHPYAKKAAS